MIPDELSFLKQIAVEVKRSYHFRELLSECGDQADTDNMFEKPEDICSYEDIVPSYEEVNKAVEKPKNIKAAETNGISTELIKNTRGNCIKELTYYLGEDNSDALKNAAGSFLMYLSESWVVKKTDEQRLAVFKRKVPRRIYGPKEENCNELIGILNKIYECKQDSNETGNIHKSIFKIIKNLKLKEKEEESIKTKEDLEKVDLSFLENPAIKIHEINIWNHDDKIFPILKYHMEYKFPIMIYKKNEIYYQSKLVDKPSQNKKQEIQFNKLENNEKKS
ncbi:hypothetical protein CWI37_0020p0050 [Hamiltosporidium tvaerminnensis]|uniref:Uncharacterized protein n=1 Tax=Hamiltosporidium tvaerminnensis TaxID=1176355 RepID=A0A4Q9LCS3_9MICR|nr:hypothetical protein CWI37_0020p0050 [Hamiltosporidium tvaerminnensis]